MPRWVLGREQRCEIAPCPIGRPAAGFTETGVLLPPAGFDLLVQIFGDRSKHAVDEPPGLLGRVAACQFDRLG